MKTGIANLPLHYGSCPRWLFENMVKLGRAITETFVYEHGAEEFLCRLSDPYFFQSLACVLSFDWHSSGATTTVCGALKEGLRGTERELGIFVCGGKGRVSRKTPHELEELGQKYSFNSQPLIYASKISAKVDNNALQDGYQLYHHTFFATKDGKWAVIQQGMNSSTHWARRYHWLSNNVSDFVNEPHLGITCDYRRSVLNLVAQESKKNRQISTKISQQKPEKTLKILKGLQQTKLPQRHEVLVSDINPENLKKIFLTTYKNQPKNFEKLLGMRGVGLKTIRALALISELVWGAPASTKDPVLFSFAHGGKDGIPYSVDKRTYQQSINYLTEGINKAKIGHFEKLQALRRLNSAV